MLRILTYHRVREVDGVNPSLVSATSLDFERQVEYLTSRYRVVGLEQVVNALRRNLTLPSRAVLITFDDGYRDFKEIAWPILKKHRAPATVFVATSYPDHPDRSFWWDRIHGALTNTNAKVLELAEDRSALRLDGVPRSMSLETPEQRTEARRSLQGLIKRLPHNAAMGWVDRLCERLGYEPPSGLSPVLGWSELKALSEEGASIAPHTRTHPSLVRLPLSEARAEIRASRDDVEREIGSVPPVFSYPFGAHDAAVVSLARAEGFEIAVTCLDGQNDLKRADPLRLARTNITRRTSPFLLRFRLLRAVSHVDRWRHRASAV